MHWCAAFRFRIFPFHKPLPMRNLILLAAICVSLASLGQTNTFFTNAEAADVLNGNYDPATYASTQALTDPQAIALDLNGSVSADSLKSYLTRMSVFQTRNTGSDTTSNSTGMGAARRWAFSRFEQFSQQNNNRLLVSYLQFDEDICGMTQHRNIMAVLPGMEPLSAGNTPTGIIVIEGHYDSRCNDECDVNCEAQGMEDNGSGSALVMELARVMANYQFNRTIVFMLTTGEEQGLVGAEALANYCTDNQVPVAAVLNNDIVGGITCGGTSSPPSCPSENDIDSTQVRMFSSGTFNSMNKQLARYIKLQYEEEVMQHVAVPMKLTVMTAEDRTGRGGDHIPFRRNGFPAMRFTSANEHGDGNPSQAGYDDRQHTSEDVLGVDTDGNGSLDSFYVDFNYLARNAVINGNAAAMIAQNVCSDLGIMVTQTTWKTLRVNFGGDWCAQPPFRVALRSVENDWDTLINTSENTLDIEVAPGSTYFVSVARVNDKGVESLFSPEAFINVVGVEDRAAKKGIELLQNRPNPFDETTAIAFLVHDMPADPMATVRIQDVQGKVIKEMKVSLQSGPNEVIYDHGYGRVGTYYYSLLVDGRAIATKKMVFVAN